jgi:hypothetical protein
MNHIVDWNQWQHPDTLLCWTTVTTKCPITSQHFKVDIKSEDFDEWQNGGLVQQIFHYLTPQQRELLQTGTCEEGWATLFPS